MKKTVPEAIKFIPPVEIISLQMKKKNEEIKELRSSYEKKLSDIDKVLAEFAIQAFSLDSILERNKEKLNEKELKALSDELRITRNKIYQALERGSVEIVDLTGREIDEEVLEMAEVIGWLPDKREKEHVLETYEPAVKHSGHIIHIAKITGGTKSGTKGSADQTAGQNGRISEESADPENTNETDDRNEPENEEPIEPANMNRPQE